MIYCSDLGISSHLTMMCGMQMHLVGKNSLPSLMSDISNIGKLSKVYRNHSVRATSITVLNVAVISGCHIMKVSGHKFETSLKSYSHFIISDGKKREISETLSNAFGQQPSTTEQLVQKI